MIEYYSPQKRIVLKTIASVLVLSFIWYDIAWAGDLFYSTGGPANNTIVQNIAKPALDKKIQLSASELEKSKLGKSEKTAPSKEASSKKEITNYDYLAYNRDLSAAEKLMPSNQEVEQTNNFAPEDIRQRDARHREVMGIAQAVEDLSWLLKKPQRQDPELELQKKKGGGDASKTDWSLTDPDEDNTAHNYNDLPDTRNPNSSTKYDITMMDISAWMSRHPEQFKDKEGVLYWVGEGLGTPDEERLIMKIEYFGTGKNQKILTIYTGYYLTKDNKYDAKYKIEYIYGDSGDLTETRKYDISDGENNKRLVEKSLYSGSGDDSRIQKTIYYGKLGQITNRRDFKYEAGALKETLYYETSSEKEGEGELVQR